MKKRGRLISVVFFVSILLALFGYFFWRRGEPRRMALEAVLNLADDLKNPHGVELLNIVLIPAALQSRTVAEQQEFITKALSDELSEEGIRALKQNADFGPVASIFPTESSAWCKQAGVDLNDCVAFRMERAGIRAEVVLVHNDKGYRIVRCNNVKQMAGGRRT